MALFLRGHSLFLQSMKFLSTYISAFLGLVMVAATLLPSLHVLDHEKNLGDVAIETKVVPVTIDCELCDFNFSSLELPEYFNYNIHLPVKETIHNISIKETVYPFPNSLFSLRAPPAVIA